MHIELQQQGNSFHFLANNEQNNTVSIDAAPAIGGQNLGARPMELLVMGLGGCSGIDVINILKKQKIGVEGMHIKIDAERQKDVVPSLFEEIHITFVFKGPVDKHKAERAVALSIEKYCSAAKVIEKSANITCSVEIEA